VTAAFPYGLLLCQLGTYDPLLPDRRSLELPGRIGQFPERDLNPLDIQLLLRTDVVDVSSYLLPRLALL